MLGETVRLAREMRRISIDNISRANDLSAVTWAKVEKGHGVRPMTYRAVETALTWKAGTITTILDGAVNANDLGALIRAPQPPELPPTTPRLEHRIDRPRCRCGAELVCPTDAEVEITRINDLLHQYGFDHRGVRGVRDALNHLRRLIESPD